VNDRAVIDPQTLPTWTAVAFIIALLALVVSFVGLHRTSMVTIATQTQVLALHTRIQEMDKELQASRHPGTAAAQENISPDTVEITVASRR